MQTEGWVRATIYDKEGNPVITLNATDKNQSELFVQLFGSDNIVKGLQKDISDKNHDKIQEFVKLYGNQPVFERAAEMIVKTHDMKLIKLMPVCSATLHALVNFGDDKNMIEFLVGLNGRVDANLCVNICFNKAITLGYVGSVKKFTETFPTVCSVSDDSWMSAFQSDSESMFDRLWKNHNNLKIELLEKLRAENMASRKFKIALYLASVGYPPKSTDFALFRDEDIGNMDIFWNRGFYNGPDDIDDSIISENVALTKFLLSHGFQYSTNCIDKVKYTISKEMASVIYKDGKGIHYRKCRNIIIDASIRNGRIEIIKIFANESDPYKCEYSKLKSLLLSPAMLDCLLPMMIDYEVYFVERLKEIFSTPSNDPSKCLENILLHIRNVPRGVDIRRNIEETIQLLKKTN